MPFGRRALRQLDRDAEFRIVMRARALDLAVGRRRQAAPLRPFLQHGLRVAQRPRRRAHPLAARAARSTRRPPDSRRRRRPRRSAPRRRRRGSRCGAGRRHLTPRRRAGSPRRDRSRAPRRRRSRVRTRSASRRDSSPSSAFGKARNSMSETTRPEHMVAEKFEPLIAAAAVARPSARRCGSARARADRIREAIADPFLERGAAALRGACGRSELRLRCRQRRRDGVGRCDGSRRCVSPCGSSHDREQPAPAHRPTASARPPRRARLRRPRRR